MRLRAFLAAVLALSCRGRGPAPVDAAPADAAVARPAHASAAADAAPCRSAAAQATETAPLAPVTALAGFDLDGDGTADPVLFVDVGPRSPVLLFLERGGCATLVATLHTNDPRSVRLVERDKSGWAVLDASMGFTFDELEERVRFDGARYVTWSRRRDHRRASDGGLAPPTAWSAWERD